MLPCVSHVSRYSLLLNLVDYSDVIFLQRKVLTAIWVFLELVLIRFKARVFFFLLIYLWAFQQYFWSVKEWTECCNVKKNGALISFWKELWGKHANEVASARTKERVRHKTAQFLKCYLVPKCLFSCFLIFKGWIIGGKKALHIKITSFVCLPSGLPTNRIFLLNIRELY